MVCCVRRLVIVYKGGDKQGISENNFIWIFDDISEVSFDLLAGYGKLPRKKKILQVVLAKPKVEIFK